MSPNSASGEAGHGTVGRWTSRAQSAGTSVAESGRMTTDTSFWIRRTFLAALTILSTGAAGCTSEVSEAPETTGESEDAISAWGANDGGSARYTRFTCETATELAGEKLVYSVKRINNTDELVDLTAAVPEFQRRQNRDLGAPTGFFETVRLKKLTTNRWSDGKTFTVGLESKQDGSRSIRVDAHRIGKVARAQSGSCTVQCEGPTVRSQGGCIWTGIAPSDDLGNFLIEEVASVGAGVLLRNAAGRAIITAVPKAPRAAPKILTAGTVSEALDAIDGVARTTNPLSALNRVGNGNCFNDAITQAFRLSTGHLVCALPYDPNISENWYRMLNDSRALLGQSSESLTRYTNAADLQKALLASLSEGQMAVLGSQTGSSTAHATLVIKMRGGLVHVNNQNWEPKVSTVSAWVKQWTDNFGDQGGVYFWVPQVFEKKLKN